MFQLCHCFFFFLIGLKVVFCCSFQALRNNFSPWRAIKAVKNKINLLAVVQSLAFKMILVTEISKFYLFETTSTRKIKFILSYLPLKCHDFASKLIIQVIFQHRFRVLGF